MDANNPTSRTISRPAKTGWVRRTPHLYADEYIRLGYQFDRPVKEIALQCGVGKDCIVARAKKMGLTHLSRVRKDRPSYSGIVRVRAYVRNGHNDANNWLFNWSMPEPNSGCWIWTGEESSNGYGNTSLNGKTEQAHRISWMFHRGEIPDDLHVLHRCDNRACVNPEHLFLGTNYDNILDKLAKNRGWKTISPEALNAIYHGQGRHKDIAKLHGVHRKTVGAIKRRETRKHDVVQP